MATLAPGAEFRGRCLCGAVEFAGRLHERGVWVCHCGQCRRWTGGPFHAVRSVDGVRLLHDGGLVWFASSEIAERGFCRRCGTKLFWRRLGEGRDWAISAGALDDPDGLWIGAHIWIDDKPSAYDYADDAPRLPRGSDGKRAAGDRAAGDRDAGDRDAGDRDAGDRDAGDRDAGDRDAGSREARPAPRSPNDGRPRGGRPHGGPSCGGCLCGRVRFAAEGVREGFWACHCGTCRRWTSGPMLAVEAAGVRFEGAGGVARYRSSDWAERGFCESCGTALFYRIVEADRWFLAVGAFDDGTPGHMAGEMFVEEKPAWYAFAGERPRLTGAEVFEAARRGGVEP